MRAPPPPGPARIDRYAGTPATPRARRVWAAIAAGRRDVEIVRLHGVSAGYVSRLRRHWQALGHPIPASGEEPPCLET